MPELFLEPWSVLCKILCALSLVSMGLWFFQRQTLRVIYAPILKVLELTKKPRFPMTWQRPPWLEFCCFCLALLGVMFFSMEPFSFALQDNHAKDKHIHIFVDVSASMSAFISIQELKKRVIDLYASIPSDSKVSLSSSSSRTFFQVQDESDVVRALDGFQFQKVTPSFSKIFHDVSKDLRDVNDIYFVSDGDAYHWGEFNWKSLEGSKALFWIDVKKHAYTTPPNNVYFTYVKPWLKASNQNAKKIWQIKLSRTSDFETSQQGLLKLFYKDKVVFEENVTFKPNQRDILVMASVYKKDLKSTKNAMDETSSYVTWHIDMDDALRLDNTFKTFIDEPSLTVNVISDVQGEMLLEDASEKIKKAFQAMGYEVFRSHTWAHDSEILKRSDLVVFFNTRISLQQTHSDPKTYWFMPHQDSISLDWCESFFTLAGVPTQACPSIHDQGSLVRALVAKQAKPMYAHLGTGGAIPVAWKMKHPHNKNELVFFAHPIIPGETIHYGSFLKLIRMVLGPMDASHTGSPDNVPEGESRLWMHPPEDMPKRMDSSWNPKDHMTKELKHTTQDKQPMFWIMVIYTLILLSMLIEIFMGLRSKRTMMIGCIGLLCGHVFWSKPCLGEVQWSYVATHTSHTGTCEGLAKEVSERTSMVMGKNFHYIDLKADDIFAQPWLWMTADTFTHMNETLKESLKYWLKRGGFLVLEGSEGREELKHWLNDLTSSQSLPSPGWVPIPPNHEVMRSFYLLDALPMCQDNPLVWYGFHFDQRLAVLSIPFALSKSLTDTQDAQTSACKPDLSFEKGVRVFINILMVALTTDYKKDQIHMKEILKRLH